MIPHTVPKRPMYGDTEPTVASPDEMRFERVDLALVRRAHRAARAVERDRRRAALLAVLRVLAKAGGEDVLHAAADARLRGALVELAPDRRPSRTRPRSASVSRAARRSWNILRKICHHDHSDRRTSSASTACTTTDACVISVRNERSGWTFKRTFSMRLGKRRRECAPAASVPRRGRPA